MCPEAGQRGRLPRTRRARFAVAEDAPKGDPWRYNGRESRECRFKAFRTGKLLLRYLLIEWRRPLR
jgi:hypothetical protein